MVRTVLIAVFVGVAAPAWAQQAPPPLPDPANMPSDPVKGTVMLFESALRQAVDSAGQQFALRASKVSPGLTMAPDRLPEVRGIHIEDMYFFDVLIPDLNPVAMSIYEMRKSQVPQLARPIGAPTVQAVPQGQLPATERVAATTSGPTKIVDADPMAPTLETFNPTVEYSAFSRDALMNALIDLSGMLPVKEGDRLTIAAGGFPLVNQNPLYPQSTRKLVITIKGSDLIEFRQGKISRDEAKARIKESRY